MPKKEKKIIQYLTDNRIESGLVQQIEITLSVMILSVKEVEYYAQTRIKRHSTENLEI